MRFLPLCPRKGAELFLLCLAACEAAPPADAVATYRGGVVTLAELEAARQRLPAVAATATASQVDRRTEAAREAAFRAVLATEVTAEDPVLAVSLAAAEEGMLAAAMTEALGWNRLGVEPGRLRQLYDQRPELYHDPEKLRLQHVFLRAEADDLSPAERQAIAARLETIRQELLADADFAELARRHSESATASGGGFMVLKPGEGVFPAFAEAAWGLEPNEVSEIVDTPNGFHVLKLVARIPPIDRPFEDVRDFVREQALRDERRRLEQTFLAETGASLGLERRYDRLRDPALDPGAPLIRFGDLAYTFTDLASALPERYQSHLYNRHFPKIDEHLDQVALRAVLAAEARRRGLDRRPELLAQRAAALTELRAEAALSRRLERRGAAVDEATLRQFFTQNQARYQTLRTVTLRVLLLESEDGEHPWRTLERAESLAARARSGEDFAALVRRYSVHYSAPQGGLLADLTDYGVSRTVQSRARNRQLIEELEEGEISDPFIGEIYDPDRLSFIRGGVYIVRVEGRHPPEPAGFDEVEDLVRSNYLRRHYQRLLDEERTATLAEIGLVVHEDRLPPL